MKKGIYEYFAIAILFMLPSSVCADFDATSSVIQMLKTAQKDGIGTAVKNSIAEYSGVSKDLVNADFSNISPDMIKGLVLDNFGSTLKTLKIDDKIPVDLAEKINGIGSSPALRAAAKSAFTVGRRSGDDVKKNAELEHKSNDLMIENVSIMYARGLARRYQLENEKKEEVEDYNNVNAVQAAYIATVHRANSRWMSILQNESSLMSQNSMQQVMALKTDEIPEETSQDGAPAQQ